MWLPKHPPISLSWFSVSQPTRADPWSLLCSFPVAVELNSNILSELPDPGACRWKCRSCWDGRDYTACACVTPSCPILCIQPAQHSRFLLSVFVSLPAALQTRSRLPLCLGAYFIFPTAFLLGILRCILWDGIHRFKQLLDYYVVNSERKK